MDKEIRALPVTELRVDGEARRIVGYAAVFDSMSEDLGGFREVIAPGAFRASIESGDDVRALFNHDPNFVLGRTASGTLRLEEDMRGLRIEVDPPDTAWARDLLVSIERGDVSQMSFAFRKPKDQWARGEDGGRVRTLLSVPLLDVSPVTYPAYQATAVGLRSLDDIAAEGREAVPDEADDPTLATARDEARRELARKRQALNEKLAA